MQSCTGTCPRTPVDFEQREGRVHRYMGHAVRKNVAAAHWGDVLTSPEAPWDAAFEAALTASVASGSGQFSPWWVYDGDARIHRRIASFTLSREHGRYERLLDALTLYRLTLGQPRQEDMLRLMKQNGVDAGEHGEGGEYRSAGAADCRRGRGGDLAGWPRACSATGTESTARRAVGVPRRQDRAGRSARGKRSIGRSRKNSGALLESASGSRRHGTPIRSERSHSRRSTANWCQEHRTRPSMPSFGGRVRARSRR